MTKTADSSTLISSDVGTKVNLANETKKLISGEPCGSHDNSLQKERLNETVNASARSSISILAAKK